MENIDVAAVAALAKFSFSENEAEIVKYHMEQTAELCSILDEFEDDVAPDTEVGSVLRQDIPMPFSESEKIVSSAPASNGMYITVPRVVGDGEVQ